MAQIVGLLNGLNNQNTDFHFSTPATSIISPGVVSGLELTQPGGAGTDVSVTAGVALVKVTRTSVTPNEEFLVVFRNTAVETLTISANQKIYIVINETNVNDASQNIQSAGTGIGTIQVSGSYPASNYIKLGETNGSGVLSTAVREVSKIKGDKIDSDISITKTKGTAHRLFYTDGSGNTQELAFGTSGQVLGFTGVSSAPAPISPSVNISGLTATTTLSGTDEFIVNQSGNKKITMPNLLRANKEVFVAGENITAGNALYILPADGKAYKTDASNSSKINFIGFATNTVSTGGNVIVDTSGVSATQSGLTAGSDYYLSNTAGAISTTPGTNIVSVGKAVSATGIQININDRYNNIVSFDSTRNTSVASGAVVYNHSLGRIPKIIKVRYNLQNSGSATHNFGNGYYFNGVNNCVGMWVRGTPAVGGLEGAFFVKTTDNAGASYTGIVSAVTSTTFTITWTKTGTTGTIYMNFELE